MKNKITLKEALDLSILKWEWIIDRNGYTQGERGKSIYDIYPEIAELENGCGLCELYIDFNNETCKGCPLDFINNKDKEWAGCEKKGHPYRAWRTTDSFKEKLDYAKLILSKIKEERLKIND